MVKLCLLNWWWHALGSDWLVLWYSFCIQDYWVFLGCSQLACYFCFQKFICNFVSRGNAWLWLSLIFWRLKNLDFLYFAVSVPPFIQLRLWWNCASWIDDNMHWALIDLFCDTLFLYTRLLSFPRLLSTGLLLLLSKIYMQFCVSRKRLALIESDFLET